LIYTLQTKLTTKLAQASDSATNVAWLLLWTQAIHQARSLACMCKLGFKQDAKLGTCWCKCYQANKQANKQANDKQAHKLVMSKLTS